MDIGYQLLDNGYEILDVGYEILGNGYEVLGIGYQLLILDMKYWVWNNRDILCGFEMLWNAIYLKGYDVIFGWPSLLLIKY